MRNTLFGDALASIVSPFPEGESGKQNSPADFLQRAADGSRTGESGKQNSPADFLQRAARRDGEDLG